MKPIYQYIVFIVFSFVALCVIPCIASISYKATLIDVIVLITLTILDLILMSDVLYCLVSDIIDWNEMVKDDRMDNKM